MSEAVTFDPITLEVLWTRLTAIVDEAAAGLVRTSFSTVVRESNDFACVLMDSRGDSVVQSTLSIPSFLGTLPITTKHFISRFPPDKLKPGDVLMTNDPWLATGHVPDVTMVTPVFYRGKLVAFAGCTAHMPDMGGRLRSPDSTTAYEEGLRIPPSKFMIEGRPNEQLLDIITANVRVSSLVTGDLMAQATTNSIIAAQLVEVLNEYGLPDLEDLSETIQSRSEEAMCSAISQIPNGSYSDTITVDGFDKPLNISCRIDVAGDRIHVDYAGTSPQLRRGLNAVLNYTYAYTVYPLKCILNPNIPNNQGCFRPFIVSAPAGSLLNPVYPAPVGGRALTGHFLHAAVFGALSQALPGRIPADSGSPLWLVTMAGTSDDSSPFSITFFANGGQGGAPEKDGLSCVSFPSNISNTPVEVLESVAPLRFEYKRIVPGSGGAGQFRGGCGQELAVRVLCREPVTAALMTDRIKFPARGREGGNPGMRGIVRVNGQDVHPKLQRVLNKGDVLVLRTPGGGGYGNTSRRDISRLQYDLENGFETGEAARAVYGYGSDSGERL